tara:strand:- start:933 stop:1274 length:342 start_codon:yes stop_codon:yes gene_type:complete
MKSIKAYRETVINLPRPLTVISTPKDLKGASLKRIVGNTIFTVKFSKINGEYRVMNCRLNVFKGTSGKSNNLKETQYLTAYDLDKKSFRSINIEGIHSFKARGKEYQFIEEYA